MSEEEEQIPDIEGNKNLKQVKRKGKRKGKRKEKSKTESKPPKQLEQGDEIETEGGKKYIIGENIGKGSGRSCYALLDNEGNKTELVILFDKEASTKKKKEENDKYKEVSEGIKGIKSDSVLKPIETGEKNGYKYEISRMGKDLPKFEKENKGEITEVSLMVGLFLGLKNLHEKHILHNDLKSNNILIINKNGSYTPVIMDFDQSRIYNVKDKEIDFGEGELPYGISAEKFKVNFKREKLENINPFKSDIYSMGVILYEFVSDKSIYESEEKIIKEYNGIRANESLIPFTMMIERGQMIQKEEERVLKGENGKLETYLISEIENCNNFSFMNSEKCKDPYKIKKAKQMFVDIFKGIFQFDEKKRDDIDKVLEKIKNFLNYLVNDMNLDPSEDLKIPNEALKEAGLENLVKNKKEEQKNEKSANKIPNMNFITPQKYNEEQFKNNLPIQSEENISSPEFDLGTNSKNNGMELKASGFNEVENLNNDKETKQEISIESGNEETKDETKENNIVVNNKQTIEKSENKQKTLKDKFDNFKTRFINSCRKLNEQTKKNNEIIKNFFTRKETKNLLNSLINTLKDLGQESELQI